MTDMTPATAERIGRTSRTSTSPPRRQIPVARAGEAEDIAHAVRFFVSDGAGFVTGQVLYVAGGPKA